MSLLINQNQHRIVDVWLIYSTCGQYKVISHFIVPTLAQSPIPKRMLYELVKSSKVQCYTEDEAGHRTFVIAVDDNIHEPYLKTKANGKFEDNLLSLPNVLRELTCNSTVKLADKKALFSGGIIASARNNAGGAGLLAQGGLLNQSKMTGSLGLFGNQKKP